MDSSSGDGTRVHKTHDESAENFFMFCQNNLKLRVSDCASHLLYCSQILLTSRSSAARTATQEPHRDFVQQIKHYRQKKERCRT